MRIGVLGILCRTTRAAPSARSRAGNDETYQMEMTRHIRWIGEAWASTRRRDRGAQQVMQRFLRAETRRFPFPIGAAGVPLIRICSEGLVTGSANARRP